MDSSSSSLNSNIRCLNTSFEATRSNALQVRTPRGHLFAEVPTRTVVKHDWQFGPSEQGLGKEMLLSKERTRNHLCVPSKFQQWCCVIPWQWQRVADIFIYPQGIKSISGSLLQQLFPLPALYNFTSWNSFLIFMPQTLEHCPGCTGEACSAFCGPVLPVMWTTSPRTCSTKTTPVKAIKVQELGSLS